MTWERVRGHDSIIRSLSSAFQKSRMGHAYLFVGPPGVGKFTLARELARAILCEKRTAELNACGKCASCSLVDAGTHPDLIVLARDEEMVQFSIGIVKEFIDQLSLKPARSTRKVAIVEDADDFSPPAANAFLKTLEEPFPGTLLILIGGPSPETQFPTILSRCQVVTFAPLSDEVVRQSLIERGIDAGQIDRLVRVAGGSIGQAVALDDEALWTFRAKLLNAVTAEKIAAYALAKEWSEFAEELGKEAGIKRRRASLVLRLLIGALQDALRISHGIPPIVADQTEAETLRRLAEKQGVDKLLVWLNRALEADTQISRMISVELIIEAFTDALAR